MKVIEYQKNNATQNQKFYNINGKDQILQRLACHISVFTVLLSSLFFDLSFPYVIISYWIGNKNGCKSQQKVHDQLSRCDCLSVVCKLVHHCAFGALIYFKNRSLYVLSNYSTSKNDPQ